MSNPVDLEELSEDESCRLHEEFTNCCHYCEEAVMRHVAGEYA